MAAPSKTTRPRILSQGKCILLLTLLKWGQCPLNLQLATQVNRCHCTVISPNTQLLRLIAVLWAKTLSWSSRFKINMGLQSTVPAIGTSVLSLTITPHQPRQLPPSCNNSSLSHNSNLLQGGFNRQHSLRVGASIWQVKAIWGTMDLKRNTPLLNLAPGPNPVLSTVEVQEIWKYLIT